MTLHITQYIDDARQLSVTVQSDNVWTHSLLDEEAIRRIQEFLQTVLEEVAHAARHTPV